MSEFAFMLKKVVAGCILPPAGPVLVALAGAALVSCRPRLGRFLVVLSATITLLLSTQFVSGSLLASLQSSPPLDPKALPSADAIVVLAGGIRQKALEYGTRDDLNDVTLERLRYAAWLAKRTNLPILVSGGTHYQDSSVREADAMATALDEDYGLKAKWIEGRSKDTAENAAETAKMLEGQGVGHILLVTHAWHMRRAMEEFRKQHFRVTPAATRYVRAGLVSAKSFAPSAKSYRDSSYALHEWLGLLWQGIRG